MSEIDNYPKSLTATDRQICRQLQKIIDKYLPEVESKIWHRHPVWFLEGNPIVGYGKLKDRIRLMFWSGADFGEPKLKPGTGKFKDASISFTDVAEINEALIKRWLKKATLIQWDYKNIYQRKGKLVKLK